MAAFEGIPTFTRGDKYDASPGIVGDGVWRLENLEKSIYRIAFRTGYSWNKELTMGRIGDHFGGRVVYIISWRVPMWRHLENKTNNSNLVGNPPSLHRVVPLLLDQKS
jgi:hypothetical protein